VTILKLINYMHGIIRLSIDAPMNLQILVEEQPADIELISDLLNLIRTNATTA
jgi:predicted transcriptional regulator